MCWECDRPGGGYHDYLDQVRRTVTRSGWAIQGIEADRIHPPWAYTVGLSVHNRPELVVTGLPYRRAYDLLHAAAGHQLLNAATPRPGEQIRLADWPLLEIVPLSTPSAHLHTAVALYGPDLSALQLVHADRHGRWPWDRRYRGRHGAQPVLGKRARSDPADPEPQPTKPRTADGRSRLRR